MESKYITGLPVIALETGKLMGKVQSVAVDPEKKQVSALITGEKIFLKTRSQAVSFDQLRSFGPDAVTISSETDMLDLSGQSELLELINRQFLQHQVISEDGTLIGAVEDFSFDPTSGKLHALVIKGSSSSPIPGEKAYLGLENVRKFGKDFVICQVNAMDQLEVITGEKGEKAETRGWESTAGRLCPAAQRISHMMPGAEGKVREMGYSLEVKGINFALGREAGYQVTSPTGEIVAHKGDSITQDMVDQARRSNCLHSLLLSAGVGEIIEGIDYATDKLDEGSRRLIEAWQNYRNSPHNQVPVNDISGKEAGEIVSPAGGREKEEFSGPLQAEMDRQAGYYEQGQKKESQEGIINNPHRLYPDYSGSGAPSGLIPSRKQDPSQDTWQELEQRLETGLQQLQKWEDKLGSLVEELKSMTRKDDCDDSPD